MFSLLIESKVNVIDSDVTLFDPGAPVHVPVLCLPRIVHGLYRQHDVNCILHCRATLLLLTLQLPRHMIHHVGMARHACDKRDATGIKLHVSEKLVAPVVIVAHNRVHYLAKCLMNILRWVRGGFGEGGKDVVFGGSLLLRGRSSDRGLQSSGSNKELGTTQR